MFLVPLIYVPSASGWIVTILLLVSGFCIGGSTLALPPVIQHCPSNIQVAAIGLATTGGYISAGTLNVVAPAIIGPVSGLQKGNFLFLTAMRLNEVQSETVFLFRLGMIPLAVAVGLTATATFPLWDAGKINRPIPRTAEKLVRFAPHPLQAHHRLAATLAASLRKVKVRGQSSRCRGPRRPGRTKTGWPRYQARPRSRAKLVLWSVHVVWQREPLRIQASSPILEFPI